MHNISKFERVTLFKQYDEGTAIQKHSKQLSKKYKKTQTKNFWLRRRSQRPVNSIGYDKKPNLSQRTAAKGFKKKFEW